MHAGHIGTDRSLLTGHGALFLRQIARNRLHALSHRHDYTWYCLCSTSRRHWWERIDKIVIYPPKQLHLVNKPLTNASSVCKNAQCYSSIIPYVKSSWNKWNMASPNAYYKVLYVLSTIYISFMSCSLYTCIVKSCNVMSLYHLFKHQNFAQKSHTIAYVTCVFSGVRTCTIVEG